MPLFAVQKADLFLSILQCPLFRFRNSHLICTFTEIYTLRRQSYIHFFFIWTCHVRRNGLILHPKQESHAYITNGMCRHSVRTRKLNMMTKNKIGFSILGLFLGFLFPHSLLAQSKSVKRGVGWDEKVRPLTIADAERLQDGVSWVYNWGVSANNNLETYNADNGIVFVPQCWNANFDESRLRTWLKTHPISPCK